jgi:glutamine cyclotransferase
MSDLSKAISAFLMTALVTASLTACQATPPPCRFTPSPVSAYTTPPQLGYRVIRTFPHDPQAFTQGLEIHNGVWYESTGLNGRSNIRRLELATGTIQQQADLPTEYFGEGITIFGDKLYQLTWQNKTGFVYDKNTLQQLSQFSYPTEGWGLTHTDTCLIMSDGTPNLYYYDPKTLTAVGQVAVADDAGPVFRLNELEYANNLILANVWQTNFIAKINPQSGAVQAWIDLTGLAEQAHAASTDPTLPQDVLNGIAYDHDTDKLYVTGKLWPLIFEIELIQP